jgi:HEAT repeat protein
MFFSTTTFLLISLFPVVIAGCFNSEINDKEAQYILNNFYADNVPEPISDRHLLSAGKAIIPYLIVEIQKKDMQKRRYAIGALEKFGDRRALPVLTKILEDRSEVIYFRDDALRAIWHIDRKLGEEYARKYHGEYREIDRTIELLREGKI